MTTLTVDLSKPIGSATHAANGSLYGVIEMKPADVQKLIAPLGAALQAGAKAGCSCSSVLSRESSAMGRLAGVLAAVVGLWVARRRGRKSRGQA